ncbi:DUF4326 domain-containing protein [Haladaptatus salinisoli]|uniref:DUF4326 domain-containing protein n=1 Tax=Haladaptatus salinisoli TaxID=2884876 RepID=UPI001D0B23C0|nr:DUF4326 domain-containing protein [Haladaptatus salinisoli]
MNNTTQTTLTGSPKTTLVNVRNHGRNGVTMIDRSTKYGNPFRMEKDGGQHTREGCVDAYREWWYANEQAELREQAKEELLGEVLGCWCTPKACHGDVILEYLRQNK